MNVTHLDNRTSEIFKRDLVHRVLISIRSHMLHVLGQFAIKYPGVIRQLSFCISQYAGIESKQPKFEPTAASLNQRHTTENRIIDGIARKDVLGLAIVHDERAPHHSQTARAREKEAMARPGAQLNLGVRIHGQLDQLRIGLVIQPVQAQDAVVLVAEGDGKVLEFFVGTGVHFDLVDALVAGGS